MIVSYFIILSQSIWSVTGQLSINRIFDRIQTVIKKDLPALKRSSGVEVARKPLEAIVDSFNSFNLNVNVHSILEKLCNFEFSEQSLELMTKYLSQEFVSKLMPNNSSLKSRGMERTITQMILNTVLPRKSDPVMTSTLSTNGLNLSINLNSERLLDSFSQLLEDTYEKERQTLDVYQRKLSLRQMIYSLLTKTMKEKIDLFLIGSSLTHLGSNSSDTDLCLIIYQSDDKIDPKYEEREAVLSKLEELSQIFVSNGMSSKAEVIPALVPILKFIETSTGIEVNINVNRVVTIRNTHLLHTYSQIDKRVAQLILIVKFWAKKNGINSAYNKSLTSYSLSLMVIHFLQSVCSPPVIPCLQKTYPFLFEEDVTQLRLSKGLSIQYRSSNKQTLGQLFTQFFEYFCLYFNFDKVISVRSGTLLDKEVLISRPEANGRIWQWKCHICIEEPFIGTNTSHAVHDCRMFREILQKFMDTYHQIINGSFFLFQMV